MSDTRGQLKPLLLTVLGGVLCVVGAGYLLLVRIAEGAHAADNEASVIAGLLAVAGAGGAASRGSVG
ncbi:hypothetical protein GCM10023320_56790 [Pseudonocardia adelaidensis]|uniref:Uncharacterized protein n=1 Tax=Pseudonocardia adelaidensis TaxID=648754 RepID=A0ABP9NU98_9PSEU